MIKYNDEYEAEIRRIVEENPKTYVKMLKSQGFKGRYPDRKYLVDYVYQCTPLLDDAVHTFKTRLYWTLNRLQDFPACGNDTAGVHKMTKVNVKKLKDGYPQYCDTRCQHSAPSYHRKTKDAVLKKYGVSNPFQIESVKEGLAARKDEIQAKRDETRRLHFGDAPGWNLKKSVETRRAKYGSAWNVKAIAETKAARYGDPHWNNSEKAFKTKRERGNLNSSRQERVVAEAVRTVVPGLKVQYRSEKYPFACDMYDPATDTYYEYNGTWTHGGHPYDPGSAEDAEKLRAWTERGGAYYENAVKTWTERDPAKRRAAAENGANLVELWNYGDVEKRFGLGFSLDDWLYFDCPKKALEDEYGRFRELCFSGKWEGFLGGRNASNLVVKHFQQDAFYAREKRAWLDPAKRAALVANRVSRLGKAESELTDLDLLDGFKRSGMVYGYSHFNPKWFMWFINKYGAESCYDPFGGWGHRLLGSMKLRAYIYNDLSPTVKANVDRMVRFFGMKNVETHCEDAATFRPEREYDSMFTCPPYFNVEEYECGGFSDFSEYEKLMDGVFGAFEENPSCATFGLVTREDMLCGHDDYSEAFDVNVGRSYHLNPSGGKKRERLYVFRKGASRPVSYKEIQ